MRKPNLRGGEKEVIIEIWKLSDVPSASNQHFSYADILKTAIGLLSQGRTHFSDTELFRQEESQIMAQAQDLNGLTIF